MHDRYLLPDLERTLSAHTLSDLPAELLWALVPLRPGARRTAKIAKPSKPYPAPKPQPAPKPRRAAVAPATSAARRALAKPQFKKGASPKPRSPRKRAGLFHFRMPALPKTKALFPHPAMRPTTHRTKRPATRSAIQELFQSRIRIPQRSLHIAASLSIFVLLAGFGTLAPRAEDPMPHVAFVGDLPIPQTELIVQPYRDGRWTLIVETKDFLFIDLCGDVIPDDVVVGKAQVHLGNRLLGTATSPIFDLGDLPPGQHTIWVTLQDLKHKPYATETGPLSKTITVTIPEQSVPGGKPEVSPVPAPLPEAAPERPFLSSLGKGVEI
ncbi:MAG: hypothetical protein AAGF74_01130 [Pseudomonadota bacterium]